jgi:hypothetical protein
MGEVLATQPPRIAVGILVDEARRRARGTGDNLSLVVLKVESLPKDAA